MSVGAEGTRWSFVHIVLGILVFAAGAADGHELVVGRDPDWPLLVRADLLLLGGFWLIGGRFPRRARAAAVATFGAMLAHGLSQVVRGGVPHGLFGRIALAARWVILVDLLILAGSLRWRPGPSSAPLVGRHPGRAIAALVVAGGLGIAIDRSQVGQFPIVATVRSGRTTSGLGHLVYLPDGYYRSSRRWPLIVTLHGRGEAGDDIGQVRGQGLPRRIEDGARLPFVIVAPQSPDWTWDVGNLGRLLDEVLRQYRIDEDRVYLVGNSMGGTGTWALAAHSPARFAAIAPICGRGDPASAGRLRGVPTWAFHGADDRIVPPEQSVQMIAAVRRAGGDARLTVYPGVGHDAWTPTYADPMFYEWLLQHRRAVSPGDAGEPRSAGDQR